VARRGGAPALIARGLAVGLLPDLPIPDAYAGIAVRSIREGSVSRKIFAAYRATDTARPSTRALLDAVSEAGAALAR
jgi:DNA-binding transcriptional LysR family regulator